MLTIQAGFKQEKDEFEDEKGVFDSDDLRDLFQTNTEKLYCCNVCLKSYAKITSYEAHLKIHSSGDCSNVCQPCGAVFMCPQELKIHLATHEISRSNTIFPCKISGNIFPTLSARKRHKFLHAKPPEWCCPVCPRKFKQHSFYIDHIHMHKLNNEIIDEDDKKSESPVEANFEIVRTESMADMSIKVEPPDSDVILLPLLANEIECSGVDLNVIPTSEVSIFNDDDYTVIEVSPDSTTGFICGECGKECEDMQAVNVHIEIEHNHQPPYTCTECNEEFEKKQLLLYHVNTVHHKMEQLYSCKLCAASFSSKNRLKAHKSTHVPTRFPCDECDNVFKGRSGLYLHKQRVHRGRKDFPCEFCGKMFALKSQRDNHHRVHTGEKPYKCDLCNSQFRAQSGLYAHRRTHSDERPYSCEVCGKRLRLPYNLRLHMRTHTGEKPYICEICGRGFSQPGDCKKHKKTHKKSSSNPVNVLVTYD